MPSTGKIPIILLQPLSMSWKQSPLGHFGHDFLHPKGQSSCSHGQPLGNGKVSNPGIGIEHQVFQFAVDLFLAPHELLDILDPFKIRNGNAARITKDIWDYHYPFFLQDQVRVRGGGTVGTLSD